LDVVPSDIAAGFLVLRSLQKSHLYQSQQHVLQELRSSQVTMEQGQQVLSGSSSSESGPEIDADDGSTSCCLGNNGSGEQVLIPLGEQEENARWSFYQFAPGGGYELETRKLLMRNNLADMAALDEGA
jgi:hypothetical protein